MSIAEIKSLALIGAGKMGGAMLAGWLDRGLDAAGVTLVDPALGPEMAALAAARGLAHVTGPELLAAPPAVAVVAVKPQSMSKVLPLLAGSISPETLVISVAAGTTLGQLAAALGDGPIVRVMPNTPAQVGRGMSVAIGNAAVGPDHRTRVTALMNAIGATAWIDDESHMDAVTAVSGSGPAYVFHMVEALAAAARAAGLADDLAALLARQTIVGAGALLDASPLDPATLRQNVTSPGGTTAAALGVLMGDDRLSTLMTEAVAAAAKRGRELAAG